MTAQSAPRLVPAEPTSKRKQLIDIYVDQVAAMPDVLGRIFTHLEISHAIGVPYKDDRGSSALYHGWLKKWKDGLRKRHGLFVSKVPKVGYKIAKPGEEREVIREKIVGHIKGIDRGISYYRFIKLDRIKDENLLNQTIEDSHKSATLAGLLQQNQLGAA